jgi:YD repeat-containing protein
MKRTSFLCLSSTALVALAILAASCASQPKTVASPVVQPAAEKQRKERLVTVQVPVLVKETSFYADGLVDEYFTYKYDAGLVQLLEKASYDSSRPDPVERVITEVIGGRITGDNVFDADGKVRTRHEYIYDQGKLLGQERVIDSRGISQSSSTYAYDAAGNRIEWKAFDGKGVLKAVTKYSYDKARLLLIDMKDGQGKQTGSIKVEYDNAGLAVRRNYLAADGSLQKYESYVYEMGLPTVVETHRADASLVTKTVNTWGKLGELLTTVTTDASGAIKDRRSFEYKVREDQKTEVYYE